MTKCIPKALPKYPDDRDLGDYLMWLNPCLSLKAADRYSDMLYDEVKARRFPTARKVMSEALKWKPESE